MFFIIKIIRKEIAKTAMTENIYNGAKDGKKR
jgi:hypothetical protein